MAEGEDRRTLWCGNLSDKATEEVLYELFLQAGPLEKVKIAKDRDGRQRNFGFITYIHEVSVPYAIELFKGTEVFQRTLSLQFRDLPGPKHNKPSFKFDLPSHQDFPNAVPELKQKFEEMINQLPPNALGSPLYKGNDNLENQDRMPHLSVASLRGNWTARHHPYQTDEFRENKGHFNSKHRDGRHWDDSHHNSHPRHKAQRRHFNDDHRGNYGRNQKGHRSNR